MILWLLRFKIHCNLQIAFCLMVKLLAIIFKGIRGKNQMFQNLIRLKLLFYATDWSLEYSPEQSVFIYFAIAS